MLLDAGEVAELLTPINQSPQPNALSGGLVKFHTMKSMVVFFVFCENGVMLRSQLVS
jgi:hypothetical protein